MNAQTARIFLRAGILMSPLALVACGGGDGPSACTSPNPAVCAAVGSAPASSTNNATNTNTNAGSLFTTAPTEVTLNAGTDVTYSVGGGTPPYTATSGNTNVGKASMSGTTLSLSSIAAGNSPVVVVDSVGKTVNIKLTVLAQGQTGAPLSLTPGELTIGDCTTNIPFVFTGGVAPYTVFTSDNFSVPVSSALPLGANSYFTASIKALNPSNILAVFPPTSYKAVLTVLDGQSRSATSTITVPIVHITCPDNPLLQISPSSANFRPTEILAFQVAGGPSSATPPQIRFSDPTVAEVVLNNTGTSFNVRALKVATTLMTVTTSDGQSSNITLTVLPNVLP